jgi:hypothetical protein
MREIILIGFVIFCVIMITVVAFIWRYQSLRNKKAIEYFVSKNNAVELGKFTCSVDKNFLSPKNPNYVFNALTLFKIESGFLICPTNDHIFKLTLHLSPLIISHGIGELNNINVAKIEEVRNLNNNTYVKLTAKYNTTLDLEIFESEGVFK